MDKFKISNDLSFLKKPVAEPNKFIDQVKLQREKAGESILSFKFREERIKVLSKCQDFVPGSSCVLYWMSRDQRVQDNWALLFSQRLALKHKIPLKIAFCLVPQFLEATIRHYDFMLKGLKEVQRECQSLNIEFHLLSGEAPTELPNFVKNYKVGAVICDMSPLKVPKKWVQDVLQKLPADVPLIQVDAHNIVPIWVTSDKEENGPKDIRYNIQRVLKNFLTEFPPVVRHPHKSPEKLPEINFDKIYQSLKVDMSVKPVEWAPGYESAMNVLSSFINSRLKIYNEKRNDPMVDGQSNLSPWLHFGQISAQRVALEVEKERGRYLKSVNKLIDELITWREMSDNFCYYNRNYDNFQGIPEWAIKSLNEHKTDKREYVYTLKEFEAAETHDDLWNAAQIQIAKEGKMHGFMRMYWAKKILEWTEDPAEGIRICVYLNDRYSIDGRDPNGYAGILWSMGGVHDRPFDERPVYGKVRYMSYNACKGKFDMRGYIAKYGGKVYSKK